MPHVGSIDSKSLGYGDGGSAMSGNTHYKVAEKIGDILVEGFHLLGLFVILAVTLWSAGHELLLMVASGKITLKDILLLFIYLELGAMIGIYFRTNHMPVRYLIYIAITAITRVLAVDIKTMDERHIYALTGGILVLSLAVLALRLGSSRFPSSDEK